MSGSRTEHRRSGNKRSKRWFWIILGILISLVLLVMFYISRVSHDIEKTTEEFFVEVDVEPARETEVQVEKGESPVSVLLLGIDSEGESAVSGRSDTMIVTTINPNKKSTILYSIPRDSLVNIPGYGQDKINHAYSFGGASLSINAVQNFLNIPVDYFAAVNMNGLSNVIDAMGGVTITPTLTFSQSNYYFQHGVPIRVDGAGALAYSRMRKNDPSGDYGRQARQRQIISTVVQEAISVSTLWNYPALLDSLRGNVLTNMTFDEMQSMLVNYQAATGHVMSEQLSGYGEMINGVYYEIIPEENRLSASQKLRSHLELD